MTAPTNVLTKTSREENRNFRGVLKLEVVVSLVLLVTMMNVVSPLVHRINGLWSNAQQHQFAINELSNQMLDLVELTPEQAKSVIGTIDVSAACKETLAESSITGELSQDKLGTRVTLKLTWRDRKNADPVVLHAWLRDPATEPEGGNE